MARMWYRVDTCCTADHDASNGMLCLLELHQFLSRIGKVLFPGESNIPVQHLLGGDADRWPLFSF